MNIVILGVGDSFVSQHQKLSVPRVIYQQAKALKEGNCKVRVIDVKSNFPRGEEAVINFHEVWNPPTREAGLYPNTIRHAVRVTIFAILASWKLVRLKTKVKIDIIHVHGQIPGIAVWLTKKILRWKTPLIYTTHNHDFLMYPSVFVQIFHFLEPVVLRKADHLIAITESVSQQIIAKAKVEPAKITKVWDGTETEEIFRFMENNPKFENSERTILSVGGITPRKNQLTLAKAMPKVLKACPDVQFVFAGFTSADKAYFHKVREFLKQNNLLSKVKFTGAISRDDLYKEYSITDIVVFPTLYEAQGLILLEGMAFGKPVIASRIGPILDMVSPNPESVILIDPNNPDEIAEAIISLLQDENLRQKLAKNGRELVCNHFTWSKTAEKLKAVYENLLAKGEACN